MAAFLFPSWDNFKSKFLHPSGLCRAFLWDWVQASNARFSQPCEKRPWPAINDKGQGQHREMTFAQRKNYKVIIFTADEVSFLVFNLIIQLEQRVLEENKSRWKCLSLLTFNEEDRFISRLHYCSCLVMKSCVMSSNTSTRQILHWTYFSVAETLTIKDAHSLIGWDRTSVVICLDEQYENASPVVRFGQQAMERWPKSGNIHFLWLHIWSPVTSFEQRNGHCFQLPRPIFQLTHLTHCYLTTCGTRPTQQPGCSISFVLMNATTGSKVKPSDSCALLCEASSSHRSAFI